MTYRPQTGYYDTIIDEAAALLESLVQNHGNKRVAFAVDDVFLVDRSPRRHG
jgi:death-on-curing protein